jgi:ElaB/YqjD/DUF883 family membrane-anchored ribosome-binding protein
MADIHTQLNRVRDAASDFAGSATERLKDGTAKVKDGSVELIQTGRDKASEAYADARDKGNRAATRANEIIQEHPIAAAAAAVAAGAVIAYMFPKSRAVMRKLPGVAAVIGTRALEAAATARSYAEQGGEIVKTKAGEALEAAKEGAVGVKDSAATADLTSTVSRFADDALALVVEKAEALSEAIKGRLPKS